MRVTTLAVLLLAAVPAFVSGQSQAFDDDQVSADYAQRFTPAYHTTLPAAGGGVIGSRSNGSVLGVDSLPNWSGYFYDQGQDGGGGTQFTWQYTMVGRTPFKDGDDRDHDRDRRDWTDGGGDTTWIGAPIIPVNIDLRNFDGSPRFINGQRAYLDATQYVNAVLSSPIFSTTSYSSSDRPTQFTDAIQRAEFYKKVGQGWHTMLRPRVQQARTLVLIRGTYRFATNLDGSLLYVLVDEGAFLAGLFPPMATDVSTVMGAAENAGDIQSRDLSTFLFPNTFLYAPGNPANCCVIGFHSYDTEPGSLNNGWRERRYVMNYSSWISPGIFGGGFADIAALSHEMSETFNDPFVNNATPWWRGPNGLCQNNLETGDVIEGVANAQFPMSLNGATWHPQNEALLQWFSQVSPSSAIYGAYSYPDTTVLTASTTTQNAGCR